MRQHSLEAAARDAGIDVPPVFTEETGSTNDDALRLAEGGAPEWTIVATNHQTAGRGRLGRAWSSAPGKLLQLSVILRPPLPPEQAPLLSLLAAVEMAEAATIACDRPVGTKWPNDVVVEDRKLGGVLPESQIRGRELRHVVVGIGVNLSMQEEDFPPEIRGQATSLELEGAEVQDGDALLAEFLRGLREAYKPESPSFPESIVHAYSAHCRTLGRRVGATTTGGETVEGTAERIGPLGELVLDGERTVAFGEVAHLD